MLFCSFLLLRKSSDSHSKIAQTCKGHLFSKCSFTPFGLVSSNSNSYFCCFEKITLRNYTFFSHATLSHSSFNIYFRLSKYNYFMGFSSLKGHQNVKKLSRGENINFVKSRGYFFAITYICNQFNSVGEGLKSTQT